MYHRADFGQLFRDDDPNVPVAVFLSRDLFHGELLNKIQLGPASGWEDILDYIVGELLCGRREPYCEP